VLRLRSMSISSKKTLEDRQSTLLAGHSLDVLKRLPSGSINCCITSPPYWGLRDYQTDAQIWGGTPKCKHIWQDSVFPAANGNKTSGMRGQTANQYSATRSKRIYAFCVRCRAWRGNLGLEPTTAMYVEHLVAIFREVRRVLKPDGTLWLVLGDCYAGSWGQRAAIVEDGSNRLKPKDLVGIPWQVAFALRADGWYLRTDIVWHKPNPMPENVKDRPTRAHESIFLLAKQRHYFYDHKAIAEPLASSSIIRLTQPSFDRQSGGPKDYAVAMAGTPSPKSARRMIVNLKGRTMPSGWVPAQSGGDATPSSYRRNKRSVWTIPTRPYGGPHFATFPPELVRPCMRAGCPIGGTVLDPFAGAGTTGLVARQEGRKFIGIELNDDYVALARKRINDKKEAVASATAR